MPDRTRLFDVSSLQGGARKDGGGAENVMRACGIKIAALTESRR